LTRPKAYLVDPGIYSYLVEKSFSKALENVVLLEFVKSGYEASRNIFYYETKSGSEVDFLIKMGNRLSIIEVSHDYDEEHVKKVVRAAEDLGIGEATIITWDTEDTILRSSIKINVKPFWKFLLQLAKRKSI